MAGLTVCTWLWGSKYGPEYVERLQAGVARHLKQPYEFKVFTPPAVDKDLTEVKGCFARLRLFDPEFQRANGIEGRVVCMDLDLIVTGPLDELFDRPEPFCILQGVNSSNPGKFNGSLWYLDAGYRPDVWADFSLEKANELPAFEFADDQLWLEARIPDAGAFTDADGVYAFQKKCWPKGDALPKDARIVAFPGWRDPSKFTHLDWVKRHWQ